MGIKWVQMSRVDGEIRLGAGGTLNRPGVVAVGSSRIQLGGLVLLWQTDAHKPTYK